MFNVFNNVVSGIPTAMGSIYDTIVSGFNNDVGFITGLASSAFRQGSDLINGIVNGIRGCIGNVVSAISNVANTIRSYIQFSVPDVRPLTDYESWLTDFMSGLAKGIGRSKGLVQKAVDGAAAFAGSYEVSMEDVEADSGGETEAGTLQRDVVRLRVVSISVRFSVSPKWLKLLTGFKQREKIGVEFFDTEILDKKNTEMFVEGYKAGLMKDTSYKGLWKVSFTHKKFYKILDIAYQIDKKERL